MSILDQRKLIESTHPFELLEPAALDHLMQKIDIAYYPKDTLLFSKNIPSVAFYIIIKGSVSEFIDEELHNVYSQGDSFDADALIYAKTEAKFVVDEDLICYEIKKEDFLELLENKKVQNYFLQDFVSRHQHLKEYDSAGDLTPFLMSRISDIYLHRTCVVWGDISIFDALVQMQELQAKVILYEENGAYAIVTDTDLRQKVLLQRRDVDQPLKTIVSFGVVSIEQSDFLFNALLLMTQNGIKRVVVMDEGRVVGILEQLDLLSYFANHSHLIVVQIDKARSLDDLKNLQQDLKNLLITLHSKGVKVRYITKLVATLNAKIYKKLFKMYVPQDLQQKCALIVMGSEGREEQSVKTDQDNALIVEDGVDVALFEESMLAINHALLEIGFPRCKGDVMVSNPFYRRNVGGYKELIEQWVSSMHEADLQHLSIFLDAKCVAGQSAFLQTLTSHLQKTFHARDDVLAHIAKAVLHFETPLSMFSGFVLEKEHDNKLDLKKGGIFALVHGVRTLALQYEISATNTIERIKELNNIGVIDKIFAAELIESFDTLSSIRLKAMLEAKSPEESNYINPANLSKIQRDLLKDSFRIINKFKKLINFHYHLNMVG